MGPKYPCIVCDKCVKWNQNAIVCLFCNNLIHLQCSSQSSEFHRSNSDWICDVCLMSELPFFDINISDEVHSVAGEITPNKVCDTIHTNTDCNNRNGDNFSTLQSFTCLLVAHLNVCSLIIIINYFYNAHNTLQGMSLCAVRKKRLGGGTVQVHDIRDN